MSVISVDQMPARVLGALAYVLFDIDDTLTLDGRLPAISYQALEDLSLAGLNTVAVTGRPGGWCDHIARMWPVDAVVGENGAFYFRHDHKARKMTRRFVKSPAGRDQDRARLAALRTEILQAVPGTAVASDQPYREADLAIDFCEDVAPLPMADVQKIVDLFTAAGARAKISSIHVNGWFGDYDKLTTVKLMFREVFDLDVDSLRDQVVFLGDSPNDEPMFGYFPVSIGVANVAGFLPAMATPPACITAKPGGEGFAEFARLLLAARP